MTSHLLNFFNGNKAPLVLTWGGSAPPPDPLSLAGGLQPPRPPASLASPYESRRIVAVRTKRPLRVAVQIIVHSFSFCQPYRVHPAFPLFSAPVRHQLGSGRKAVVPKDGRPDAPEGRAKCRREAHSDPGPG